MKEKEKQEFDFPKTSAPAERALLNANIKSMKDLSKWREEDLAKLHGMGPKAIKILKTSMKKLKLSFKK